MAIEVVTSRTHAPTPGGSSMPLSGVLDVNTTTFSSPANTVENDAISYTLLANTLNSDGKMLRVTAFGKVGLTVNGKTIRMYLGSTQISQSLSVVNNGSSWIQEAIIVRDGVGSQKAIWKASIFNADYNITYSDVAEDETTALVVKVTAQNGTNTAADIVVEGMIVELLN